MFDRRLNIEDIVRTYRQEVYTYIDAKLPRSHAHSDIVTFYEMLRDYPSRPSKGLRAALCMLTCEAFGGQRDLCIPTAAAIEIFQSWVLIHDDIEDDSEMRRGQPVLHKKFGIPMAINAGDALHGKMWEVLLENKRILGESKTLSILEEFCKMVNETTEGQHLELTWVCKRRWDLVDEDYFFMCGKKTSWYTAITPFRLGAIIADADKHTLEQMVHLGYKLGLAFQIRDDALNLMAEEKYGKEAAGDIYESKRTLILIDALKRCSAEEREKAKQILDKPRPSKNPEEVKWILDLINKTNSLQYALGVAEKLAQEAKQYFEEVFKEAQCAEAKDAIRSFIEYMVSRRW
ncbi:MAG: polyprenyl synthetase family protein [Nitrososphaerales archaeon]